ncbi:MAG: hypothetical protein NVS9B7_18120 [Flavisolibacter sp.]
MNSNDPSRRNFLKYTSLGLGGMSFSNAAKRSAISESLNPLPKDRLKKLNILCVGAHPGDPEFGCGGTLGKYSRMGHHVVILYITRGEAGDPKLTFAQSGSLRTKEAEASCLILNVKPIFAGQVDANTELNKNSIDNTVKMIGNEHPDIVFAHWPMDTHPDHQVAGLLAFNAWVRSGQQFDLYYYEVNAGSETLGFAPTDYVDISEVRDLKKAAMFTHKTQNPEEIYTTFFKTMEEFRGLEAGVKAAEGFMHFKAKEDRTKIRGL